MSKTLTETEAPTAATRDDALRSLRETDLFVKIRRLTRRNQLKLRELIDRMLVDADATSTSQPVGVVPMFSRADEDALRADIAAARTWARTMGRAARILPGDVRKGGAR